MNFNIIGQKRNREKEIENKEKQIYQRLNIPYKDDLEEDNYISYILSQIQPEYEESLQYCFLFDEYQEYIQVSCLWGNLPLIDGIIANFTRKIEIKEIAEYVNFGKRERVFNFFTNIQCLLNVDNDSLKKLSFFENGKFGFIFKGQKDYFLLINIKSLDEFDYMSKNSEYCQLWLIKIDDKNILNILNLKPMNETIVNLSKTIEEYKKTLDEKDSIFQKERREFNERINKIVKVKEQEYNILNEKYNKLFQEKNDLIEQIKNENKNRIKRVKKFIGLKTCKDYFSIIEENNVVSYEELSGNNNDEMYSCEDKSDYNNLAICVICFIRPRNILFEKCGHICICDECLDKCKRKVNKNSQKMEYFCPICNNQTKRDEGYSTTREIFLS